MTEASNIMDAKSHEEQPDIIEAARKEHHLDIVRESFRTTPRFFTPLGFQPLTSFDVFQSLSQRAIWAQ